MFENEQFYKIKMISKDDGDRYYVQDVIAGFTGRMPKITPFFWEAQIFTEKEAIATIKEFNWLKRFDYKIVPTSMTKQSETSFIGSIEFMWALIIAFFLLGSILSFII